MDVKRIISFALSLTLSCTLAVPAFALETPPVEPAPAMEPAPAVEPAPAAEPAADARLTAVTEKVKAVLGLDTGEYENFYGELDEDILAPTWRLSWSGKDGELNVSAAEDGKILRYYADASAPVSKPGFAPAFPAGNRAQAKTAAEAFVKKLLTTGETVSLEDAGSDWLGMTSYRFRGEIKLNGLSAGLTCSVSVDCADNRVTSFSRDDLNGMIMGGVPAAQPEIDQAAAGKSLRGTLKLRLEYELAEDGGKRAVLRYLPDATDEFYVDAASGELVNLTELRRKVDEDGGGVFDTAATSASGAAAPEAAAGDSANKYELTEAEQAGAAKLEGVLSREALDQKARAVSALGLGSYTLSTANYIVSRGEDGKVFATLRYGRQVAGDSWRRTVTLDARTGALESVHSSAWAGGEDSPARGVTAEKAKETAEAFLRAQAGGTFAKSALYDSEDALENDYSVSHSFTYAQKANGYFFPGNTLRVGVDSTDGSISAYNKDFDESVTFDSPAGILSMEQALDKWLATYGVTLRYVQVPTAVDYSQPDYAPLAEFGIRYLHRLVLGYDLEREDYVSGIDAKTGAPVASDWFREEDGLSYSDIAGHWAASRIEELAHYNVGYTGGKFQPNARLTQLDLIALLLSADGYRYEPDEKGAADALYRRAYERGILKSGERADEAPMDRLATVRLTLNAMGYGPVAKLQGVYRTNFTDDALIPADGYGYAALAQGLGMVTNSTFSPAAPATRAQAAVMLYNLLARQS